ncbi:MAG: glycosyltransferase [Bacteroidales bacterium]|nr:glycosyltransferase [Bacteroidales bacterium]
MRLSFIICTYNRHNYLKKCVDSIITQRSINLNEIEIVIVDNNSTDKTKDLIYEYIKEKKFNNIKYVSETNQGLSYARNKGVNTARGEWLAFIDDDAYLHNLYVYNFFALLNKNINAVAFGGPILLDFETQIPKWYNNYIASVWGYFKPYNKSRFFSNNIYPRGSNMIIKKEIFDKYGLFNTHLGRKGEILLGGEEKEFFLRMKNEKFYFDNSLIIFHYVPENRVNIEYIKKQSIFIGLSERIRIKNCHNLIFKKLIEELKKTLGSFLIALKFLIHLEIEKSIIIIKLRFWIIKGLTNKNYIS